MKKEFTLSLDFLKSLTESFAPSGAEESVIGMIEEKITPYADEIIYDNLGSLIAVYKKRVPREVYDSDREPDAVNGIPDVSRIMLCAHTDEVGFMVKSITDKGFLKIAPLALKDPSSLASREVTVGNGERTVSGVITSKPIHLGSSLTFESLYVDIGAKDKEEAEKHVSIGDFGAFSSDFTVFGKNGGRIKGKALSSRIGCAVLCEILRELAEKSSALPFDLCFAFTKGREIGVSSASCAAKTISPDLGIILDSARTKVTKSGNYSGIKLSDGALLPYLDRSAVFDREWVEYILSVAKKTGIRHKVHSPSAITSDSGQIALSGSGVKLAAILYPTANTNTASQFSELGDINAVYSLLMQTILSLK